MANGLAKASACLAETLLLCLAFSGCVDQRPSLPRGAPLSTLIYELHGEGAPEPIGEMIWSRQQPLFSALTAGGEQQEAYVVRSATEIPGLNIREVSFHVVSTDSGKDLVTIAGCDSLVLLSCSTVAVSWDGHLQYDAWFGAHALAEAELEGGRLFLPVINRSFDAHQQDDDSLWLKPDLAVERTSPFCNVIDDETLVDIRRQLVLVCRPAFQPTLTLTLRTTTDTGNFPFEVQGGLASDQTRLPFGLGPRDGVLPPGANTRLGKHLSSFGEMHREIMNQSNSAREFLAREDNVWIERSSVESRTNDSSGPVSRIAELYNFTYGAPGGQAYFVAAEFLSYEVSGNRLSSEVRLVSEGRSSLRPRHSWEDPVALLPTLVSFSGLQSGVESVLPGFQITDATILNSATSGDGVPRYIYRFSGCRTNSLDCGALSIEIDAGEGRFLQGTLSLEWLVSPIPQ